MNNNNNPINSISYQKTTSIRKITQALSQIIRQSISMETMIFILGVSLTYWMILAPCWKAQRARIEREYDEVYHAYRLRMVRRFYPEVRHLSFRELEENFDIKQAFDRIGSFTPPRR